MCSCIYNTPKVVASNDASRYEGPNWLFGANSEHIDSFHAPRYE